MTRETLVLKAYQLIKRDILEGRIALDTVLSERELSARYGLSRTPLRTAFSQLEREGIVSRLNGGTLLVRSVSVEQFFEIIMLRKLLEGAAAARAAERGLGGGLGSELAEIRVIMQAYAEGRRTTFDDFWVDDGRFHVAVARAAGLSLLPGIIEEHRTTARRCTIARRLDRFFEQAREHLEVLDAIERGDAPAARAAMDRHFDNVRLRFLESLASPWPPRR